jgi:hypothetical protein
MAPKSLEVSGQKLDLLPENAAAATRRLLHDTGAVSLAYNLIDGARLIDTATSTLKVGLMRIQKAARVGASTGIDQRIVDRFSGNQICSLAQWPPLGKLRMRFVKSGSSV